MDEEWECRFRYFVGLYLNGSLNANFEKGNAQGNVILFEPSTSEHISARTIFDPITAIAPAADCRTYAIG